MGSQQQPFFLIGIRYSDCLPPRIILPSSLLLSSSPCLYKYIITHTYLVSYKFIQIGLILDVQMLGQCFEQAVDVKSREC